MLRTCVLVLAIASAAQATEIQNGQSSQSPDTTGVMETTLTGKLPGTGLEILRLLESLLVLF